MNKAWREILRRPGVSATAWLALALGIALNTAMFSVVEGFLLRPLPVDDIGAVVRVREVVRTDGSEQVFSMAPDSFAAWREHNGAFTDMAAATGAELTLTGGEMPVRLQAAQVTANFFDVLGVRPLHGRTFVDGEDRAGTNDVVLLSDAAWRAHLGGELDAIGDTLMLDGRAHTVIGVMPPGLHHPYNAEIWVPFAFDALLASPSAGHSLYVPARLRPGLDLTSATARLDAMIAALGDDRPGLTANASQLTPLRDELLGSLRPVLYVLLGNSLLVLLLAVANVTNLLYARSIGERHETALRVALGAGRAHLFARALARHALLLGGACAAALAFSSLVAEPLLGLSAAASIDEFDSGASVNPATIGYAVAAAAAIALLLAWLEARAAYSVPPSTALARGRGAGLPAGLRWRLGALVVLQIALSFALAGGATLVATGYDRMVHGERGYEVDGLTVASLSFPEDRYPDTASRAAFVGALLTRAGASPGVASVAAATVTPDFPGAWGAAYVVPGHEPPAQPGYELTNHRLASAGYFATMEIPLVAGRDFDAVNGERDANTVIVSRAFAERYWGSAADALGRTVNRLARGEGVPLTVIGVVGDVAEAEQSSGWDVAHAWYLPLTAGTAYDFGAVSIVLRGSPTAAAALRAAVREIDPELALADVLPMSERLASSFSRERMSRFLFGVFGVVSCVIALIGLIGALHFVISLRRREFGIRMALGASSTHVAGGVMRQSLGVTVAGIALGLPLLAGIVALLRSYFVGVDLGDSMLLVATAGVLLAAAALAGLAPARNAARTPPAHALLEE